MKMPHAKLVILVCAVGSVAVAAEPPEADVKHEIAELKEITRQLLDRLERLEASLSPDEPREPSSPAFNSPRQAFDTLQQAQARQDWRTVVACYTPSARDNMAKGLVLVSAFVTMAIEDEHQRAQYESDLEKLNAMHFLPLPEITNLAAVGEAVGLAFSKAIAEAGIPGEEQQAAVEEIEQRIAERREPANDELAGLVKHIKDRDAYLADVLTLLEKYNDSNADYSSDRLVDVKAREDEAEGFVESPGKPPRRITFKRITGAWRVDRSEETLSPGLPSENEGCPSRLHQQTQRAGQRYFGS